MTEWKKDRAERRADFDKLAASVEGAGEASTGAPAGKKLERSHAQRLTFELFQESDAIRYSTLTIDEWHDGYGQALKDVAVRVSAAYVEDEAAHRFTVAQLRARLEDLVDQADAMAGGDMAPGDWTLLTESIRESRELLAETKPSGRTRASKTKAAHAVRECLQSLLELEAEALPDFNLVEDGETSWVFWIMSGDTTSYVHHDLSIEWYGTAWEPREETEDDEVMF